MIPKVLATAGVPLARKALTANSPSVTALVRRLDHHGPPANYKFPTMDELPLPCGSWQEHYDNNQRKYNIHLLLGIGCFILTIVSGFASGAFDVKVLTPTQPLDKETMIAIRKGKKE